MSFTHTHIKPLADADKSKSGSNGIWRRCFVTFDSAQVHQGTADGNKQDLLINMLDNSAPNRLLCLLIWWGIEKAWKNLYILHIMILQVTKIWSVQRRMTAQRVETLLVKLGHKSGHSVALYLISLRDISISESIPVGMCQDILALRLKQLFFFKLFNRPSYER